MKAKRSLAVRVTLETDHVGQSLPATTQLPFTSRVTSEHFNLATPYPKPPGEGNIFIPGCAGSGKAMQFSRADLEAILPTHAVTRKDEKKAGTPGNRRQR